MTEIISLVGASLAWFAPIAAVRVYENAFALSYTTVNLVSLSVTPIQLTLLAFLYMVVPHPKIISIVGGVLSLAGFILLITAQYFTTSLDPTAQLVFWVAVSLIGFNFADNLLKAFVNAATTTSTQLEAGRTQSANRTGSMALLGLPFGMLAALIITELLYDVKDTYFTNEKEALQTCCIKGIILLGITFITDFWGIFFGTLWSTTAESPIASRALIKDFFVQACNLRTLNVSLQLTLAFSAFLICLQQPENLTNSFAFTSQDSKLLLTYYVIGTAIGCSICPALLDTMQKSWLVLWVFNLFFVVGAGLMLGLLAFDKVSVVLSCMCQMLIGVATMGAILTNLKHIGEEMTLKNLSQKNAYLACTVGLAGIGAASFCYLSDWLYYLNRNQFLWVYLLSSAFPGGFLLVNALLHHITAQWLPPTVAIKLDASQTSSSASSVKK